MAGRGSGKTEACAHYVTEHVKGPPCLNGPAPHWIGIIAPTLGDAVTACYAGPSGIRAHDPDARLRQSAGGTVIQWPNGSEAKLFGASNPEDVERLRAGGNRCIREGTLIRTDNGSIAVENVRPGTRVWTRSGLRRVLATHSNGVRPLWQLVTTHGTLELTGDHEVATSDGWSQVSQLKPGSTVAAWHDHTLRTTEFGGTSATQVTSLTHDEAYYTATSTNEKLELSRRGSTSTTKITIRLTTKQPTSSLSTQVNTFGHIQDATSQSRIDVPDWWEDLPVDTQNFVSQHAFETHDAHTVMVLSRTLTETRATAMLIELFEVDRNRRCVAREHTRNGCVACAELSSLDIGTYQPQCAVESVNRSSFGRSDPMNWFPSRNDDALIATRCSVVSDQRKPKLAHATVLCVKPCVSDETGTVTEAAVYDLTVEHDHEFFANEVLVANCLSWLEEVAAWRYLQACWEQMRFGLRSGPRPHWIGSTTPKPRPLIKKLAKQTPHDVVVTRASTDNNPHLEASIRSALYEEYGGQQIGRQELHAEVLEEDAAALWTREVLERTRVGVKGKSAVPETFSRLTVGVDPSGGAGEQGIVVVGRASIEHVDERGRPARHSEGFVLADKTVCLDPHGWSRTAVQAAIEWEADDLVVERNYGGAMAMSTLLDACDGLGVSLPVREVTASRGKRVRAEPVSALTNRDRWHLAGYFPELEDQCCTWTIDSDYSPDRLDAMVWPAWHMGLVSVRSRGVGSLPLSEFARTPIA
jgi:phage terminase large subunit-like protein